MSRGHDFEHAVGAVMHHARDLATRDGMTTERAEKEAERQEEGANLQWQRNWFDGLGYCLLTLPLYGLASD